MTLSTNPYKPKRNPKQRIEKVIIFSKGYSIKYNKENMPDVVSPCGLCRYTFDKLNMDFNVIVMDSEKKQIVKVKPADLLPYPYHR